MFSLREPACSTMLFLVPCPSALRRDADVCRHPPPRRRNRRATVIQKYVRMFVQLRRFRRETDIGRRRAVQAAAEARADAAAVVIQKNFRRRLAARQVPALPSHVTFQGGVSPQSHARCHQRPVVSVKTRR